MVSKKTLLSLLTFSSVLSVTSSRSYANLRSNNKLNSFHQNLTIEAHERSETSILNYHGNEQTKATKQIENNNKERRSLESRIVGGSAVTRMSEYPFYVVWESHGCGGSLIYPDVVLTAAHCWKGGTNLDQVTVDILKRSGATNANRGMSVFVKKVYVHPNFNGEYDEPEWDYAVLILEKSIPPEYARPIKLNTDTSWFTTSQDQANFTVMGFGAKSEYANSGSHRLQSVQVDYVPNNLCSKGYGRVVDNEAIMCAGDYWMGGRDACYGDSGSPLVYNLAPNDGYTPPDWVQVGLVSWGDGCGRAGYPGIYARVSSATPWIYSMVCLYSMDPPLDDVDGFCSTTTVVLPRSLQVELQYSNDPTLISWGLYHIDSGTTIYESGNENGSDRTLATTHSGGSPTLTVAPPSGARSAYTPNTREHNQRNLNVDEIAAYALITKDFQDLQPGMYYFQIRDRHNDNQGMLYVKLLQGGQRQLLQLFGGTFDGFAGSSFEIQEESLTLAELAATANARLYQGELYNPDYPTDRYKDGGETISESIQTKDADITSTATTSPTLDLTVEILYDDQPLETSWEVFRYLEDNTTTPISTTSQLVYSQPSGAITSADLFAATFAVSIPGTYEFILHDSGNNGIADPGWIRLWVGHEMADYWPGTSFTSKLTTIIDLT